MQDFARAKFCLLAITDDGVFLHDIFQVFSLARYLYIPAPIARTITLRDKLLRSINRKSLPWGFAQAISFARPKRGFKIFHNASSLLL